MLEESYFGIFVRSQSRANEGHEGNEDKSHIGLVECYDMEMRSQMLLRSLRERHLAVFISHPQVMSYYLCLILGVLCITEKICDTIMMLFGEAH